MNRKLILTGVIILFALLMIVCIHGLKKPEEVMFEETTEPEDNIVIGFSQLGAESDWRSANTDSMVSTFTDESGYTLIVEDGQQKQSNQITAIRRFIQQEVDYIVLAPVTETGWDTVLMEAREAHIPVIIIDRMVDVSDKELYTCWIGSDFFLEGLKASEWLNEYMKANSINPTDVHIADIQGTLGASAQIGRSEGLKTVAKKYKWDIVAEADGDFTQAKGYEATRKLLKEYADINVLYCENDNEALGAIKAIEDSGRAVGTDILNGEIMIISFDGVGEQALINAKNGKISCYVECNPNHGPRVQVIIDSLERGEQVKKFTYIEEDIYSAEDIVESIDIGEKTYNIVRLGDN